MFRLSEVVRALPSLKDLKQVLSPSPSSVENGDYIGAVKSVVKKSGDMSSCVFGWVGVTGYSL